MSQEKPKPLIERMLEANPGAKLLSDVSEEEYRLLQQRRWRAITDDQWHHLQSLSGLSDQDRQDVENDITLYRNNRDERRADPMLTPAETRDELQKLAADAQSLHEGIERALENDIAVQVLSKPANKVWENLRVWRLSDELRAFSTMVRSAAELCEPARPGPRNDNLWGLVGALAHHWSESTGLPISVSNKRLGPEKKWNALEFIITGVKLADPSLKGEDAVIRNLVKRMARDLKSGSS